MRFHGCICPLSARLLITLLRSILRLASCVWVAFREGAASLLGLLLNLVASRLVHRSFSLTHHLLSELLAVARHVLAVILLIPGTIIVIFPCSPAIIRPLVVTVVVVPHPWTWAVVAPCVVIVIVMVASHGRTECHANSESGEGHQHRAAGRRLCIYCRRALRNVDDFRVC